MDVLVPKIGEIIGGSQREERLDQLKQKWNSLTCVLKNIGGTYNFVNMAQFLMQGSE